ncbi:MAG TPA: ABC transporter ATP-binding protein [Candidatus Limnocylindrales bacterium]|nr:ABC transporter ATP-binding protein [Candidatus Limnocylindrales bacterium]
MLSLESVTYRYAGAARPSLHDVSVAFGDGEVIGIAGRSDAGKTTLCLVASGLAPRTVGGEMTGRLVLDGADAAPLAIHQLTGRIGIAFASPATQLSGVAGTVYEEIAFGPMNLGLPRSEIIERTGEALATLRIEPLAARDPARLSGGQQQLVAIAGLLALRPAHLVLDEPTAQLDPAGTRLVGDRLAQLAADGFSIVIAEQKTDLLAAICQRVVVLDSGRVILNGTAASVLADPLLEALSVAPPAAVRLERAALAAGIPAVSRARLRAAMNS